MGTIEGVSHIQLEGDMKGPESTYFFREYFYGKDAFEQLIKYVLEHRLYEKITLEKSYKAPPEENGN